MAVPLIQKLRVGAYLLSKHRRQPALPLVLMLEPLFRCNSLAPAVARSTIPTRSEQAPVARGVPRGGRGMRRADGRDPGGEPLLPRRSARTSPASSRARVRQLCTNALLLEKKPHLFTPSPYLTFSVHLDGEREHHDKGVCQTESTTRR